MNETSSTSPFTWFGDVIAAAAIGAAIFLAWIKDRLSIYNRIKRIEKEVFAVSTKMDLLIDMHSKKDTEDV